MSSGQINQIEDDLIQSRLEETDSDTERISSSDETDSDAETDSDTETGSDTEIDSDTETESDSSTDPESSSDAKKENDSVNDQKNASSLDAYKKSLHRKNENEDNQQTSFDKIAAKKDFKEI